MNRGDRLRLAIERPAAGGRMIARHEGAVVFVSGAIPGEVVDAEVEKLQRGSVWAATRQVLEPSPDRLAGSPDGACGGSVFAHIAYDRQRALKAAIIDDSLRRLGHITLPQPIEVVASPIDGYRMRARLHVRGGRIGFFREGTHAICDAAGTRQLRADTADAIRDLERSLAGAGKELVSDIDVAENIEATERAIHLDLHPNTDPSGLAALVRVANLTGASCAHPENPLRTIELFGTTTISDAISERRISRHVRSFFQGNRYLLRPFVDWVLGHVARGPLVDLYAGVGLFSVTAARRGAGPITAVEGDTFAARDLRRNAGDEIDVLEIPVERFRPPTGRIGTVIVDPPRTGLSKDALARALGIQAAHFIYVSCDIATLARDARRLVEAGYRIQSARAFDLFPNTAHVETVISFAR
jgi:23S rRNA (uracil1939-C5)-methyltransferase